MAPVLLGECPKCTPIQEKKIERIVSYMQAEKPVIWRALFVKFILEQGINVDEKEKQALELGLSNTKMADSEVPENADINKALKEAEELESVGVPTDAPPAVAQSAEARRKRRSI